MHKKEGKDQEKLSMAEIAVAVCAAIIEVCPSQIAERIMPENPGTLVDAHKLNQLTEDESTVVLMMFQFLHPRDAFQDATARDTLVELYESVKYRVLDLKPDLSDMENFQYEQKHAYLDLALIRAFVRTSRPQNREARLRKGVLMALCKMCVAHDMTIPNFLLKELTPINREEIAHLRQGGIPEEPDRAIHTVFKTQRQLVEQAAQFEKYGEIRLDGPGDALPAEVLASKAAFEEILERILREDGENFIKKAVTAICPDED